jgi:hypothetical protein
LEAATKEAEIKSLWERGMKVMQKQPINFAEGRNIFSRIVVFQPEGNNLFI